MLPRLLRRWLAAFGIVLAGNAALAKELVFLAPDYPPYASQAMPDKGAIIAVLIEALSGSEWEPRVRFVPWARVPLEIRAGGVAGALPLWPKEITAFGLIPGNVVFLSQLGFFVRKDDWPSIDTRLDHMAGKRVCTVRGYGYPDSLAAAGIVRDEANTDEANLTRITLGRCDYVAVERAVGEHVLSHAAARPLAAQVVWKEPAFEMLPLHIGVAPDFPQARRILTAIDAGVERLRKSGRLKELATTYQIDLPTPASKSGR